MLDVDPELPARVDMQTRGQSGIFRESTGISLGILNVDLKRLMGLIPKLGNPG